VPGWGRVNHDSGWFLGGRRLWRSQGRLTASESILVPALENATPPTFVEEYE